MCIQSSHMCDRQQQRGKRKDYCLLHNKYHFIQLHKWFELFQVCCQLGWESLKLGLELYLSCTNKVSRPDLTQRVQTKNLIYMFVHLDVILKT